MVVIFLKYQLLESAAIDHFLFNFSYYYFFIKMVKKYQIFFSKLIIWSKY